MKIIYKPTGSAAEYAYYGLNIYKGCTHKCKYCYCAQMKHIDAKQYFSSPAPKSKIIDRLRADCRTLINKHGSSDKVPEVLMSFQGDVYQPVEKQLGLTRYAIEILKEFNIPFTILTKGGMMIERDFDLLKECKDFFRLGVSMSLVVDGWIKTYEPNAAPIEDRIKSLRLAKKMGISTWVSMEPIIDEQQALWILKHYNDCVDHWWLGKMSDYTHNKNEPQCYGVDWGATRDMLTDYLDTISASYSVKESLKKA